MAIFRRERNWLSDNLSVKFSIDNVLPLKGRVVCGLHCHTNLRIITAEENNKKANKTLDCFRTYCPPVDAFYLKKEN
jgi:hypothetical protein